MFHAFVCASESVLLFYIKQMNYSLALPAPISEKHEKIKTPTFAAAEKLQDP